MIGIGGVFFISEKASLRLGMTDVIYPDSTDYPASPGAFADLRPLCCSGSLSEHEGKNQGGSSESCS